MEKVESWEMEKVESWELGVGSCEMFRDGSWFGS